MKRKKDAEVTAQDFSGVPRTTTITPIDIQQKEFRISRFGGYKMRDVDEYLDEVTEAMSRLTEDNERLRGRADLPTAPAIGAPDLADTSRQADEIIERARVEAARMVQEARTSAAAGGPGGVTDAGRAAVGAFLAQEREFLQGLATLVQGHAETMKGMAKASRSSSSGAASARSATPPPAPAEPSEAGAASAKAVSTPEATKAEAPKAPVPVQAQPPVRLNEPEPASVGASEGDEEGEGSGDGSLRELFWGED